MKDKIIVTGGCGYIGSHTVITLIHHNYEVVIIDDLSNSSPQILDRIESISGVRPHFEQVDLKSFEATQAVFKTHKDAKAVIHFAAHKAVAESIQNPLMYYQNNLFSLLNVLKAQQENSINHLIFSSSATVYGNPSKMPITEDAPTQRSSSPYGNTKKIAEEILEDFTNSQSEISVISLRYFNPIGAHASGQIGEFPSGIPNNLMPYITQTAAGIREKLMVFGNDYPTKDGTPIRDYIHVVDLAEAHLKALERLLDASATSSLEVFNLGTGNGFSVLEMIKAFEAVSGRPLNYEITDRRPGDVPEMFASTTLAKNVLQWEASRNLKDMIQSSWTWEQNLRSELK
ncbi:UDP-glucose 4-epimerase GalE [Flavobacteriaceae bacterium]|nr:UDP-glucose 4-epimerase GalE [Flavobacteriaceae bacterium]MDB4107988.1 UDP-glucose 4-epimerase GalE [Flavobacteriaceae bacterium]MDB4206417.1 UDP-glucose 4-epimerase GalE [Flavobacteriaceae bacterium]